VYLFLTFKTKQFQSIIVKIITNKLGEKYFKKKALVIDVVDKYTGVVKLLDSETTIKLDQAHLETVLPALGKLVLVLNGAYRGETAVLEEIDQDTLTAKISLAQGPLKGRVVKGVQLEDISKLNQQQ
jgi:DNA/RNA-binding protein KIN17